MAKIIKIVRTLRNHWKKSTFAFAAISYGIYYGTDRYRTFQILRSYCEEAKKYGEFLQPNLAKPRHVTVILNPEANEKKAKIRYEKFAAPLLHLAGLKVSVIETESEGQAIDLMEIMDNTDAVVIAGGNGTLQEAVTGLLRRPEYQNRVTSTMPIGVIPLGKTNTVAKALFNSNCENEPELLAKAAIAVVRESIGYLDVLRIQSEKEKPDYSLVGVDLGTFPSLEMNLSKYWYFGPLKARVAYFISLLKGKSTLDNVDVDYVIPCEGCSKCFNAPPVEVNVTKRWWSGFVPRVKSNETRFSKDYSKIVNDECGNWLKENGPFSNLMIATGLRHFSSRDAPEDGFWINMFPRYLSITDFLRAGNDYHKGKSFGLSEVKNAVPAREVKFSVDKKDNSCLIDSEKHEGRQFHITLLQKRLAMYS